MKWILLFSFLVLTLFSLVFEVDCQKILSESISSDTLGGHSIDCDQPVDETQRTVYASGRVEGVSREIQLFTTVRELVTEVPVREGDIVHAGQLIVQLDDRLQRAELDLAQAGVQLAEAERNRLVHGPTQSERAEAKQQSEHRHAEMISAAKILERSLLLADTNAISRTDLDEIESRSQSTKALFEAAKAHEATICDPPRKEDLDASDARLAAAKARLSLAEAALSKTSITAPSDGQILQINVEMGELPTQEPLVIMCDTQTLQVRANVDEFDALRVQIGQPVRLQSNATREANFRGRVARISPRMHNKQLISERPNSHLDTRAREIWVEIEPEAPLIVGLPVELWIGEGTPESLTLSSIQ